jgi:WXG100 family type VII secretion target
MPQAVYDIPEIRSTAQQAAHVAADINAALNGLHGQMERLTGVWQGAAATAMSELYRDYEGKAKLMTQELDRISHALTLVAANVERTEAELAQYLSSR